MFIFTKRAGRPVRVRLLWWPLVLSIVLTVAVNLPLR